MTAWILCARLNMLLEGGARIRTAGREQYLLGTVNYLSWFRKKCTSLKMLACLCKRLESESECLRRAPLFWPNFINRQTLELISSPVSLQLVESARLRKQSHTSGRVVCAWCLMLSRSLVRLRVCAKSALCQISAALRRGIEPGQKGSCSTRLPEVACPELSAPVGTNFVFACVW